MTTETAAEDPNAGFSEQVKARMAQSGTKERAAAPESPSEPLPFPRRARTERMHPAESLRRIHCYVVEAGTPIADVMEPGFWQPMQRQLSAWDRIEILEEAGAYFAELIVLSVDTYGARLAPLRGVELHGQVGVRGAALRNTTGARVEYRGPHLQWCVVDGDSVLKDRLPTEAEAHHWLANHVRTQSR